MAEFRRVRSLGIRGVHGYAVTVECFATGGVQPNFDIVGLPDTAVKEARERSGFRGGTRRFIKSNFEYTSKVLYFLPSKLLIYGKCHNSVLRGLHQMGIECIVYSDFRELCREVA